jgi:hypothetical protein
LTDVAVDPRVSKTFYVIVNTTGLKVGSYEYFQIWVQRVWIGWIVWAVKTLTNAHWIPVKALVNLKPARSITGDTLACVRIVRIDPRLSCGNIAVTVRVLVHTQLFAIYNNRTC